MSKLLKIEIINTDKLKEVSNGNLEKRGFTIIDENRVVVGNNNDRVKISDTLEVQNSYGVLSLYTYQQKEPPTKKEKPKRRVSRVKEEKND
jgi:hypothetical protein